MSAPSRSLIAGFDDTAAKPHADGFPFWGALTLTLVAGTLFGAAIELTVIRRGSGGLG